MLGTPEFYGPNFEIDFSIDEYQSMLGEQATQMLFGIASLTGTTFLQETGGVVYENLVK